MYRDQNSPGGVAETETGVAGGSDCGLVEDVTVAVEGRKGRRKRWREQYDTTNISIFSTQCKALDKDALIRNGATAYIQPNKHTRNSN